MIRKKDYSQQQVNKVDGIPDRNVKFNFLGATRQPKPAKTENPTSNATLSEATYIVSLRHAASPLIFRDRMDRIFNLSRD